MRAADDGESPQHRPQERPLVPPIAPAKQVLGDALPSAQAVIVDATLKAALRADFVNAATSAGIEM